MTMERRSLTSLLVVLAAAASFGCRDTPLASNVNSNFAPVANAGEMQTLDFGGSPVTVKLDGSKSTDPDGKIVKYRWLSGTVAPDGGMGRIGPDPDDVESPTVTLDAAGTWIFTLSVIDNEGGVSKPASVKIQVGGNSTVPPEVTKCSSDAEQSIAEDCRLCLCGLDDTCRTAVMGCDKTCWDFYTCVQTKCTAVLNDMAALPDCVRSNCSAFFGGVGPYMALEPCLNRDPACKSTCMTSVQGM